MTQAPPLERPRPKRNPSWIATIAWIGLLAGILIAALALFEFTGLDLSVQDRCYDFAAARWKVPEDWFWPRVFFYQLPKILFGLLAAFLLAVLGVPRLRKRFGWRPALVLLLAMISVPALVGVLKKKTDVYFPSQIQRYGGREPYVKLFESYPPRDPRRKPRRPGHGFPAGHASGGFALMALAAFGKNRRERWGGVAIGLSVGWMIGIYQTLNGAHYLSHTVVTNLLAGMLVVLWIGGGDPWREREGNANCTPPGPRLT
jgi:membrane-associated PAP2 superfamily phosphatase